MSEAEETETFRIRKHERDELRIVLMTFDGRRHLSVQTLRRDANGSNATRERIEARAHIWRRLQPEIESALNLMEVQAKDEGGPEL